MKKKTGEKMGGSLDSEMELSDLKMDLNLILCFYYLPEKFNLLRVGKGNQLNTFDFSLHAVLKIFIQSHVRIPMPPQPRKGVGKR